MKLYVALAIQYDEIYLLGVFSTREAAERQHFFKGWDTWVAEVDLDTSVQIEP